MFDPATSELFLDIEFAKIEPALETRHLDQGEVLCSVGEDAECLWVIAEGLIHVSVDEDGSSYLVSRQIGEVIGEQAVIDTNGKRSATMTAALPSRLVCLSKSSIENATNEIREQLYKNIASILSDKLRQSTEQRATLIVQSGEAKGMLSKLVNPDGFELNTGKLKSSYASIEAVIWFSDIVGFSSIVLGLEPEAAGEMIRESMSAQADIISAHNGFIDKFQGDGLMAYWPVRDANDDLRKEAVEAAITSAKASLSTVRKIRNPANDSESLDLRIGLHLGCDNVIRGNFGSSNRFAWTLIGTDVNLAARLEQAKSDEIGPIRLSNEFWNYLDPEIQREFERSTDIQAKERVITVRSSVDPPEAKKPE